MTQSGKKSGMSSLQIATRRSDDITENVSSLLILSVAKTNASLCRSIEVKILYNIHPAFKWQFTLGRVTLHGNILVSNKPLQSERVC